jgi:hypothetical protein
MWLFLVISHLKETLIGKEYRRFVGPIGPESWIEVLG